MTITPPNKPQPAQQAAKIELFSSAGKSYHYVIVSAETWPQFQELVQRGANLWPDAPPAIKEFADLVTTGKVQQDYRAQESKLQGRKADLVIMDDVEDLVYEKQKYREITGCPKCAEFRQFNKDMPDITKFQCPDCATPHHPC